jgi:hypothetical protein
VAGTSGTSAKSVIIIQIIIKETMTKQEEYIHLLGCEFGTRCYNFGIDHNHEGLSEEIEKYEKEFKRMLRILKKIWFEKGQESFRENLKNWRRNDHKLLRYAVRTPRFEIRHDLFLPDLSSKI